MFALIIYLLIILRQNASEPSSFVVLPPMNSGEVSEAVLELLHGTCIDNLRIDVWWSYRWCSEKDVSQLHMNSPIINSMSVYEGSIYSVFDESGD